ncbi:protein MIS12 homolog isoform X3 [Rhododendron vialii]|uniref:protein MIS12 homolog isoform X3 n=1 Tax=Rhododendron vialii TaxID=182163 RepID=UPI00265ED358|nr:protein MIS12 homolog isoform X3 [Rhododendron vialii]
MMRVLHKFVSESLFLSLSLVSTKMEGSESEAVFDALNLNPQLFINEAVNCVRDMVDDAFDYYHQNSSEMLKIEEGTERSQDISENEFAGDSPMDLDISSDQELDAQLDKLRNQLALLGKENSELDKERRALERQSLLSNRYAGSVNEALQLYEQHSVHDMFQELTKTASELRKKMEQQKPKKLEQSERIRRERMHIPTGELPTNRSNGLFKVALEELQEFNATIKNV